MKLFGNAAGAAKYLKIATSAAIAAAAVISASTPAQAAGNASEQIRRLDIMLMVTALRCRNTADNFNAEYGQFTTSQMANLQAANAELKAGLTRQYGAAGANRQLDRISTTMANAYGLGHPWLSCKELKQVARDLSQVRGRATLAEAADQLLGAQNAPQYAYARR